MHSQIIDCRTLPVKQAGLAILDAYNAERAGGEFVAVVDCLDAGLRIWLVEAGVKHTARQEESRSWRLTIHRGLSPAQGTIPGLHHVATTGSADVWACERARRLARFAADTGEVLQVAEVATKASHLALDQTGQWVFVADPGADVLLAVSTDDLSVKHAWDAPGAPQLPLVTHEGIVCVTGGGSGTLTIVRPGSAGYVVETIEVGGCPHDPLLAPDGKSVLVPCAGDGKLVSVDLENGKILGRFPAGEGPSHAVLHPDGSRIYSANTFDGTLSCLSVEGDLLARQPSGGWAHQPAITPDGCHVYVANFLDDTVSVFETDGMARIATLDTEAYPHGLDISPDGRWVIATGFSSDHLRVYDAKTRTQAARIETGRGSSHIAFTARQELAYVACSVDDHLARLDLQTMTCTGYAGIS